MKRIGSILIGVALSVELCLLMDVLLAVMSVYVGQYRFSAICIGLLLAMLLFSAKYFKASAWLLLSLTLFFAASFMGVSKLQTYRRSAEFVESMRYRKVNFGKYKLFGNKKVMLIVPYEDYDINVLGGVIDEYVQYGSDFYVVFMTNGDYFRNGEERIKEALALYDYIGIPEDHVIFLGYGDSLSTEEYHIYNAPENELIISRADRTQTYGSDSHLPFRTNRDYTRNNLHDDLMNVILRTRPDTIYCVDYDPHMDHKACSMLFEKVMGEILLSEADYQPEILKGFAYSTAWGAEHDFFKTNIESTKNAYKSILGQYPEVFQWNERVRVPVKAGLLARSLQVSKLYRELSFYQSQNAAARGISVINGDKVFWRRSTDSLCRFATISASSGESGYLNDFMLLDSQDIQDQYHDPFDGAWIPDEEDQEKMVTVHLPEKERIQEIVLYDNPAEESNIINALICFDDGTTVDTGPLNVNGAPSRLQIEKEISSFQIKLLETEGADAGLTEVEVFNATIPADPSFIKIVDKNEDFVYDYFISIKGTETFFLYSDGELPILDNERFVIFCDSYPVCDAKINNQEIQVKCPPGQRCIVKISSVETGLSDTIYIQNPTIIERLVVSVSQIVERIELEDYQLLHFVGG